MFVTGWSRLCKEFSLLVLACWEVCALMPHQIDLNHLGFLPKATWVCTALYHSSTDLFPCWKLVSKSNLALASLDWGLQNSSNLSQMVSTINSSMDKFQETYWSMPKSPLHAITFLHCLFSGNMASSHPRMFSHLKCHLMNLWYRPSFTVQSILDLQCRSWT